MDFSDGKTALGAHAPISSYKCNYEARNSKKILKNMNEAGAEEF